MAGVSTKLLLLFHQWTVSVCVSADGQLGRNALASVGIQMGRGELALGRSVSLALALN